MLKLLKIGSLGILFIKRGIAYAGMGEKDKAIDAGEKSIKLMPLSNDGVGGSLLELEIGRIYALVCEHDKAIQKLDYLLSIPGEGSVPCIEVDKSFDSFRDWPAT